MELVNIDDLEEMEYDGVTFDMQAVKEKAFGLVAQSPGYMNLLKVNVHRILNDEYAANVVHGERDILTIGSKIEKCRIVCPGPNLKEVHFPGLDAMPTILCNKAILTCMGSPAWDQYLWLVTDQDAEKCDWFKQGITLRNGKNCCFPTDSLAGEYNPEYTMHVAPCFPSMYEARLIEGVILNGASIAGMALQVAFYRGAEIIEFAGADFEGDTYWDGSETGGNHSWDEFRMRMNNFIKVVKHHGVDVYSRTETALDIEVRK